MVRIESLHAFRRICQVLLGLLLLLSVVACGDTGAPEQVAQPAEEEAAAEEAVAEEAVAEEAVAEEAVEEEMVEEEVAQEEEAAAEEVAEEEMAEEVVPAGGEEPAVTILLTVPAYPGSQEIFDQVFNWFREENPDIALEISYVPAGDYYARLVTMAAAGETPDAAVLSYNIVADFQAAGLLERLNDLPIASPEYFLPEALALNTFREGIYGLPWLRSGCAPAYESLSAFRLEKMGAIERLFTFLTRPDVQLEIYGMSRGQNTWLPTTREAFAELGLPCEVAAVLPLDPGLVTETIGRMEESAGALREVLGNQQLAPERATAVTFEEGMLARAAPVADSVPEEEALERLNGEEGLTVGALSLLEPPELNLFGDFVVSCRREADEGNVLCTLTDPNYEEFEVPAASFQEGLPSVPVPVVIAEEGSIRKCFYLDGLKICIQIG